MCIHGPTTSACAARPAADSAAWQARVPLSSPSYQPPMCSAGTSIPPAAEGDTRAQYAAPCGSVSQSR